jgi:hypothetical protein
MRHPYPCEFIPSFETKHQAQVFIEAYQIQGHIKRCAHLSLDTYGDGFVDRYGPKCAEHSFELEETGRTNNLFHGCPKNCRLYKYAWWRTIKKSLKGYWWPLRRGIIGTAQWYASLSMPVQVIMVLILLTLILTVTGSFIGDKIIEAMKIVFGK